MDLLVQQMADTDMHEERTHREAGATAFRE